MTKKDLGAKLMIYWPIVAYVMIAVTSAFAGWYDVKSDVRVLDTRVYHTEDQIKELKAVNDAIRLEIKEGFQKSNERDERIYNAILNRHNP